ncbi:glycosyltransferase [Flavobacterium paronense]|uniref:Glycosyltransferase n=1 Tax=Flavobacterium paronense TaxID=1392775 RepID=A0ABV5GAN2_9FLAO|nr:glycosyltransferase [Flavobacterium paronense]MDN3676680.1 glycosyltransferase [Flavobacterium paronense]
MIASKKKVCLVIPSLHAGGMERVMSELLNEFHKDTSLELHLVLYGIKPEIFYKIPNNISIYKPSFVFDNRYRFYYTIKTLLFLRKQLKTINPNTILSFGEIWNNFVLIATLGCKFPVFVSDRCQPNKSLGKLHDFLRKKLYPRAAGIIAQTENAKAVFGKLYSNNNIEVIGNPIREITSTQEIQKENIVLSVGRLIASKHHDVLIRLFVAMKQSDWKLVIVGDDAIKQQNKIKLKQLIDSLGASESVILAGNQTNVEHFYLKSKLFAFTSSSEGFPNVVGEALSSGLPVVCFDSVAGISDMIVDGENGYLIPLFDNDLFQEKLSYLIKNEAVRLQMSSQTKTYIERFSKKSISQKFKEFILKE